MRLCMLLASAMLIISCPRTPAQAAATPSYDVSSIRPSPASSAGHNDFDIGSGKLECRGITLPTLLQIAFSAPRDIIFNIPSWASTARFDIVAKDSTTNPAELTKLTSSQSEQMMRTLLAERFGLKSHTELREVSVYELEFMHPAPALTSVDAHKNELSIRNQHLEGKGIAIDVLAKTFSDELHRPVVDETKLSGFYDVDLRWLRNYESPAVNADPDPNAPPILTTAVEEQLGLKLRAGKQKVPVVVIDQLLPPNPD